MSQTVCCGRFSDTHGFEKPNDLRALELMNHAAKDVMEAYPDIVLAFGESDEFRYTLFVLYLSMESLTHFGVRLGSFLLHKSCTLYNRRHRFAFTRSVGMLGYS